MIKPNTNWRTASGIYAKVTEVADGYVHYTINKQQYSCYEEAFKQRFYLLSNKHHRHL